MRREWIEMLDDSTSFAIFAGLPPCGGSGLKYDSDSVEKMPCVSPSMRREWIEMFSHT